MGDISQSLRQLYYKPTEAGKRKRALLNLPRDTEYSRKAEFTATFGNAAVNSNVNTQKNVDIVGMSVSERDRKWFQDIKGEIQLKGYINNPILHASQMGNLSSGFTINPLAGTAGIMKLNISRAGEEEPFAKVSENMGTYGDSNIGLYRFNTRLDPRDPLSKSFAHSLFSPDSRIAANNRLEEMRSLDKDNRTKAEIHMADVRTKAEEEYRENNPLPRQLKGEDDKAFGERFLQYHQERNAKDAYLDNTERDLKMTTVKYGAGYTANIIDERGSGLRVGGHRFTKRGRSMAQVSGRTNVNISNIANYSSNVTNVFADGNRQIQEGHYTVNRRTNVGNGPRVDTQLDTIPPIIRAQFAPENVQSHGLVGGSMAAPSVAGAPYQTPGKNPASASKASPALSGVGSFSGISSSGSYSKNTPSSSDTYASKSTTSTQRSPSDNIAIKDLLADAAASTARLAIKKSERLAKKKKVG